MNLHDYEIEEEILDLLRGNAELTALIGDKIDPVYIQKDTEGDAVYYDSELDDPLMCKMGNVTSIMHLYFCAVCSTMINSNKIIGLIQDTLEGTFSEPYMRIRAVKTQKDGSDLKYEKAIEFIVEW